MISVMGSHAKRFRQPSCSRCTEADLGARTELFCVASSIDQDKIKFKKPLGNRRLTELSSPRSSSPVFFCDRPDQIGADKHGLIPNVRNKVPKLHFKDAISDIVMVIVVSDCHHGLLLLL
jgi:hypothetical protein